MLERKVQILSSPIKGSKLSGCKFGLVKTFRHMLAESHMKRLGVSIKEKYTTVKGIESDDDEEEIFHNYTERS